VDRNWAQRVRSATTIAAVFVLSAATPAAMRAQDTLLVRVRVTDVASAPVPGVEVTVVSDSARLVYFGRTDVAGQFSFTIERGSKSYRISARRIGYLAASRQITVGAADTIAVEMRLTAAPAALDTIRVAARPFPLAKQPFIGSDEIERDTRSILSLRDVVMKMRPDIDYQAYKCPTMSIGPMYPGPIPRSHIVRMIGSPDPPRAKVYINGTWIPSEYNPWDGIYAEHIAQVMYVTCHDKSIPGLPPSDFAAVYVALKPGFAWDQHSRSTVDLR
jgi:hypothetical protein